ncbi:hypothetical protein NDU88_002436 [Pleurodeles waltl]|uniref:Uncharacterized protein n=1 Tax=Pleurodeles waltl TaxID=8319 RepID=A0AAV7NHY9_PLEWA|nr:hypothetical protein NDU88_002436 [Pleurodeles waltl]
MSWLIGRVTSPQNGNILMKVADRIWRRYVAPGARTPPYSPKITLLATPGVDILQDRLGLTSWTAKGIQPIGELFAEGRLKPYEALAEAYKLGPGEFITHGALQYLILNETVVNLEILFKCGA